MIKRLFLLQELPEAEKLTNSNHTCEDLVDECGCDDPVDTPTKDFTGLTEIYWVSCFVWPPTVVSLIGRICCDLILIFPCYSLTR